MAGKTYIYPSPNISITTGYIFTILNFVKFKYIPDKSNSKRAATDNII